MFNGVIDTTVFKYNTSTREVKIYTMDEGKVGNYTLEIWAIMNIPVEIA